MIISIMMMMEMMMMMKIMMIMKGCGGGLQAAARGYLAPDPSGAADCTIKTRFLMDAWCLEAPDMYEISMITAKVQVRSMAMGPMPHAGQSVRKGLMHSGGERPRASAHGLAPSVLSF